MERTAGQPGRTVWTELASGFPSGTRDAMERRSGRRGVTVLLGRVVPPSSPLTGRANGEMRTLLANTRPELPWRSVFVDPCNL
jgi:hypothetical protein